MERYTALEAFVRVVDTGSFTTAARQLGISQSGVSKSISRLEAELDVVLLQRSTRGLRTTEAGSQLYARAKGALGEINEALRTVQGSNAALKGHLRVSSPVGFGRQHLLGWLPRLMERHPGLEVQVTLNDCPALSAIAPADLCFRQDDAGDAAPGMRAIGAAKRWLVASPDYLHRHGEPRDPAELDRHRIIAYPPSGHCWEFLRAGQLYRFEVAGRLTVDSSDGLRGAILAHAGLAVASTWDIAPELASGAVRPVLADWTLPDARMWAVSGQGPLNARAEALINLVQEHLDESLRIEERLAPGRDR